ncbi:MAG: hypothetical protein MK165_11520 [Pirellulaceae bacterium]|nr:hypothetical protein [Pirellulaceae bacterium]
MATSSKSDPHLNALGRRGMIVSRYDQVSGLLVAAIIFVGFFVLLMFAIWLTQVLKFSTQAIPVTIVEEDFGRGEAAEGFERSLEEPGLEEMEELLEPQIEANLEAVTDLVSSQSASLNSMSTSFSATSKGTGMGDSRAAGTGGDGEPHIPRWERWQIQYNADNLTVYARQLDFFRIEVGAAGGGVADVEYAKEFSQGKPARRAGPGDAEDRLFMSWTSGALKAADRALLSRAGISAAGRVILQFYPPATENLLATIELQYAGQNGVTHVKEIRRTVFGVRESGDGFEYFVVDQIYRNATI